MRADRLMGQASILFLIFILAILSFSFVPFQTVYAAPEASTQNATLSIEGRNPEVLMQVGPQVDVAMAASFQTINAGDSISFTISVINKGPGTAQSVTLTDNLPTVNGLDWTIQSALNPNVCSITNGTLTCAIGSIPAAGWFWVKVSSPTTYQSCQKVVNTAAITVLNEPPENTTNNTASAFTTVLCPSLAVTKTAGAETVVAGTPASFTMSVVNNGPGTAYAVRLTDPLLSAGLLNWAIVTPGSPCTIAGGTLSCPAVDLVKGASITVQISAPTSQTTCGNFPNVLMVLSANHPTVEKSAEVNILCGALMLEKTTSTPQVSAGEPVRFSMKVTNPGTSAAQVVTLTDSLPVKAGLSWQIAAPVPQGCAITNNVLTCAFGTLQGGESRSVTVTSPTTFQSCGELINQARVTDSAGRAMDASASANVLCPQLSLNKSANPAKVEIGSPLAFTIQVGNSGLGAALNVHLNDPLPAGISWTVDQSACKIENNTLTCDWASLTSQAQETVHLTGSAPSTCSAINNTVTLTAANSAPLVSSASITVTCPDVTVSKTADKTPLKPGDTAGFTIVVKNSGSGTAKGVALLDTLPSGAAWNVDNISACQISGSTLSCALGDMAAGQSITVKVSGVIGETCARLTNQVSVSATNEPQELTKNNSAAASIDIQCLADLIVSKTAVPTFDQAYLWSITKTAKTTRLWQLSGSGAVIDFSIAVKQTGIKSDDFDLNGQITIKNPNPSTAISGVSVTDKVNNGGVCTVTGGTDISVPAGGTVVLNYHCDYADDGVTNMSGVNTATVAWDSSTSTPDHAATATAAFTFGSGSKDNPKIKNQTVTIRDTFKGSTITLGQVTGLPKSPYASKTFAYPIQLPVLSGCKTYTNTALIKETEQSSSVSVIICGSLETGAQPPSFWHDYQGQKMIRALNGNSPCSLTTWLRQFPPFQDLSSRAPCPAAANYVKSVVDKGNYSRATLKDKLKAEALATALNIFLSSEDLGGNALNAPDPIGGYIIDLTRICSNPTGEGTCTLVDAKSAFKYKASLTILKALTTSASESNSGGSTWYGNNTTRLTLALQAFQAINNEWVFGVIP